MSMIFRRFLALKLLKPTNSVYFSHNYAACSIFVQQQPLKYQLQGPNLQIIVRNKSKSSKKKAAPEAAASISTDEDGGNDSFEDDVNDKTTKLMNLTLKSLRIDALLKAALGVARNKLEVMFYENKLRINGLKVLKKSHSAEVGDEVDIVKGVSINNPEFLMVARVEVLDVKEKGENFLVKVRRCKSLTIENYGDKWKPTD